MPVEHVLDPAVGGGQSQSPPQGKGTKIPSKLHAPYDIAGKLVRITPLVKYELPDSSLLVTFSLLFLHLPPSLPLHPILA